MSNEDQSRLASLETTVQRLDRAHRRQKRISSILILGMVGLLATGLSRPREVAPVEGSSLTILNDAGGKLAWIGDGERGGEIRLFNHDGKEYWRKSPPKGVPAPLTEQQFEGMSLAQVQSALAKVAKARTNPDLDGETKARLKREFDVLIRLIRELKKNGG